jgi:Xaa-Pro aminopeptidase
MDKTADATADEKTRFEAVGEHYDLQMMLTAREKTLKAMRDVAGTIRPGMLEEEAMELLRGTLKGAGLLRGWHAPYLRFGPNTLKNFGEPSEPNVALRADDIFFVDIGPVWQKWEGDAGDTFVVGNDPQMHKAAGDVRRVFADVAARWRMQGTSGMELYDYAATRARELGWELNLAMNGHRLSDFPHKALHNGGLSEAPFAPTANLWVLEIQIRHPDRPFSAFYEDLLLDQN